MSSTIDRPELAPAVLPKEGAMDAVPMSHKPVLTSGDKLQFAAIVEGAAANPNLCVIANRYPWQARIACEKLLQVARDNRLPIRMLSGRCHEGFYNVDFAEQLKKCKERGCDIRMLVWQKSTEGISSRLVELSESGVISLRVSGTCDFEDKVPHFMLVGDSAFRQEAGHPPFTTQTNFSETEPLVPARIDFDDRATGTLLRNLFDVLWG